MKLKYLIVVNFEDALGALKTDDKKISGGLIQFFEGSDILRLFLRIDFQKFEHAS